MKPKSYAYVDQRLGSIANKWHYEYRENIDLLVSVNSVD